MKPRPQCPPLSLFLAGPLAGGKTDWRTDWRWRTPRLAAWLTGCLMLLMGCSRSENKSELSTGKSARTTVKVAAAADLQFAFPELIQKFQVEQPNIDVQVTYGSSGSLFTQLSQQAPFDIFFSADISYPRKLIQQGQADRNSELQYAIGHLVVWVPKQSPIDVEGLGIQALLAPAARKIAIANPRHAPYGRAAEAALKALGVHDQVKDKLVLGENISQTAQFVESGAADIGIIALSLALAPGLQENGRFWQVPLDAHPPLEQGCVILNWAQDPSATETFRSFVAGPRGREILQRFGFKLP